MPLNKITVFYKNDTDQGIGLEMNQDAFKKGKFEGVVENLKDTYTRMWNDFANKNKSDELVKNILLQLEQMCKEKNETGELSFESCLDLIGDVWLLTQKNIIETNDFNGCFFHYTKIQNGITISVVRTE
ncbi:MAG: hypothetical protein IPO06_22625 [Leptospiraceae bacterium]|jgi:hypothetical protein|nr:hypothetical protein [Leptospiraceae bacterium]MBK9502118.1 hypothetical protein [Leptospiraceae bacterium]